MNGKTIATVSTSDAEYAAAVTAAVFGINLNDGKASGILVNGEYVAITSNDIYVTGVLNALTTLTDREQHILTLRLRQGKTLKEAGDSMKVTRERIRQVEAKALRKLRHPSKSRQMIVRYIQAECEMLRQVLHDRTAERDDLWRKLTQIQKTLASESHPHKEEIIVDMKIDELGLSVRSWHCLTRAGIGTIGRLLELDSPTLTNIRNLGRKSVTEIIEKMEGAGHSRWAQKMRSDIF